MKATIHPEYVEANVHCTCGNACNTRSTKAEMHVDICSKCHPFFTGEQRIVDTAGRVERFTKRLEKSRTAAKQTRSGKKKAAHRDRSRRDIRDFIAPTFASRNERPSAGRSFFVSPDYRSWYVLGDG